MHFKVSCSVYRQMRCFSLQYHIQISTYHGSKKFESKVDLPCNMQYYKDSPKYLHPDRRQLQIPITVDSVITLHGVPEDMITLLITNISLLIPIVQIGKSKMVNIVFLITDHCQPHRERKAFYLTHTYVTYLRRLKTTIRRVREYNLH